MVQEYLTALPEELAELSFPAASNREVWDGLRPELRSAVIRRGERFLGYDWPALTCGEYLAFSRTGERDGFEEKYNARRRAVCALAMAECVEHRGRFLNDLADGLWLICEESGWQLPAHNNYVRDTPPLPLPDPERPVADLFACETAASLSLIRSLLGPELDRAAPGLCRRIWTETDRRVVRPYLDTHFWWMGNGDEPMCNWTAWCTQNVLLTVFTSGCPQDVKRAVAGQAAYSLDCFLKDYGEDGCCEEGAVYYRRAGLCLWGALEVLDRVSGGVFAPLFREEKVKNIASYIVNVHVGGGWYLNYADCAPKAGPRGAQEYLFGRRTGDLALQALACGGASGEAPRDVLWDISLFAQLLDALHDREMSAPRQSVPAPAGAFYPSTGLWIARDETWCVSVRAGHNGCSHGHCDSGSLIVYRRGRPLLIDIGVGSYTAKTFSSERYSIWTMRSDWHNLPAVNGAVQSSGRDSAPASVERWDDGVRTGISMELAPAYPPQAGTFSYRRRAELVRGASFTVEDCWQGEGEAVLSLLFCQAPLWRDGALCAAGGGIRLSPPEVPDIEAVPISDRHLRESWPDTLYRARVKVRGCLRMEFF